MDFKDVTFLSSRASFSTTFLEHCGRGGNLGTATLNKTKVGPWQGHAPCKICWGLARACSL